MSHGDFSKKPVRVPTVKTKHRLIKTAIPAVGTEALFKTLEKFESRSMHGQLPIIWESARDYQVKDHAGNTWIDFTSTIFVANVGHGNPEVISAIKKELSRPLLHTYTYASDIRAKFLEKLITFTPAFCEKAFLMSSGTEASECAIKLIRMVGQERSKNKLAIISFVGNMHGRTMGAEMLKGMPETSQWIGYRDPNMYQLPFPLEWTESKTFDWKKRFLSDMEQLKKKGLRFEDIAGFAIESYQGWGAVLLPKKYVQALSEFAKKHHALVMFDEIQSGFGRTGKLFCYEHYSVTPDLICIGKALGGGVPLSAVIGRKEILDAPAVGAMSSTHSAQPIGCAAGLAVLNYFEKKKLVKEAHRKGIILHKELQNLKKKYPRHISHIAGAGMVAALFITDTHGKNDSDLATAICEKAMQKGLILVHTGRETIKIGPPLTIPDAALREGITVIDECLEELTK